MLNLSEILVRVRLNLVYLFNTSMACMAKCRYLWNDALRHRALA
jgi:hypothetical protein